MLTYGFSCTVASGCQDVASSYLLDEECYRGSRKTAEVDLTVDKSDLPRYIPNKNKRERSVKPANFSL